MYRQASDILRKTSGIAYYRQISEILMHRIEEGEYQPGSRLPTELDLGRQFGVNRHTAREALKKLKNDGIVFSVKGKGNFVSDSKIRYRVSSKVRFTKSILEAGLRPGTELIGTSQKAADADLAEKLGLVEGEPVLTLEMLRSASGIPLIIATSSLSATRFIGLGEKMSASSSLYQLLKEQFGIEPSRSESVFETVMPDERDMRLLQIAPGVPLLLVRSIARDQFGDIVEYCETRMRGDIGSMVVNFE
jgi:GntR family transcriptional regulator, phosphonate transport system regulatory protein